MNGNDYRNLGKWLGRHAEPFVVFLVLALVGIKGAIFIDAIWVKPVVEQMYVVHGLDYEPAEDNGAIFFSTHTPEQWIIELGPDKLRVNVTYEQWLKMHIGDFVAVSVDVGSIFGRPVSPMRIRP